MVSRLLALTRVASTASIIARAAVLRLFVGSVFRSAVHVIAGVSAGALLRGLKRAEEAPRRDFVLEHDVALLSRRSRHVAGGLEVASRVGSSAFPDPTARFLTSRCRTGSSAASGRRRSHVG